MIYRVLADVTLAVHFAFILFVVLGGLLVAWRGEAGYTESFIERYLLSFIYPQGISETGWILLGTGVVAVNLLVYGWVRHRRRGEGLTRASFQR